jgi:hypothetical protein
MKACCKTKGIQSEWQLRSLLNIAISISNFPRPCNIYSTDINTSLASTAMPLILLNPNFHYRIHNNRYSSPFWARLIQPIPHQPIHLKPFKIILPFPSRLCDKSLSFEFFRTKTAFLVFRCVPYSPPISLFLSWWRDNIGWGVKTKNTIFCSFLLLPPLGPWYLPLQQPLLQHCQTTFFL